ncbi:MAG TPA: LTA synthase family protein [Solimonas sp.]|nr:LTA synthase family protein [Solimonas sp.]
MNTSLSVGGIAASRGAPSFFAPLGRYRPLAVLFAAYLAIGVLVRVVLWATFTRGEHVSLLQLLFEVVPVGALNDAFEAIYLFLPPAVLWWLAPRRLLAARGGRRAFVAIAALMLYGMLYIAVMEFFFFDEFNARFNLVAVDYLIYPTEVIGNIRETYPVVTLSIALAVLTLTLSWWLRDSLTPSDASAGFGFGRRTLIFAAHVALVALTAGLLRAATFEHGTNRVVNELADNGPANFFAAFRTNQLKYPQFYRTIAPAKADAIVRADLANGGATFGRDPTSMTRHFTAASAGLGKRNVVVITEESFGAEFVGAYGDDRGLTPNFDRLARDGLLFRHAYATGTRTVRGLEAISASFPPIPSESIIKRPGNDRVVTWGEVLAQQGYQTSFLYGGYGAFDDMNDYFAGNGFAISDRRDIPQPSFANIWGVADEDLFRHAIDYYDAHADAGKPLFSIIMSTSNHKPYTFPAGIDGVPEHGGGRKAGVRYADYAIGRFFDEARKHAWFANTVFVIVADHDARVYGAADVPLHSYEIPLLIFAPGLVAPGHVDTPTSQIDIAPTVMGLLGLSYDAPFFGQDVLHWHGGERSLLFNHNHDVALLRGSEFAVLGLNRSAQTLSYFRRPGPASRDVDEFHPAPYDESLVDLATAYYQTGYRLFTQDGGER